MYNHRRVSPPATTPVEETDAPSRPNWRDIRRNARNGASESERKLIFSSDPSKWDVKPRSELLEFELTGSIEGMSKGLCTSAAISKAAQMKLMEKNQSGQIAGDLAKCVLIKAVINSVKSDLPIPIGVQFNQFEGRRLHAVSGERFAAICPAHSSENDPVGKDLFTTEEIKTTGAAIQISLLTHASLSNMISSSMEYEMSTESGSVERIPMYLIRKSSLLGGYCSEGRKAAYLQDINTRFGQSAPKMDAGEHLAIVKDIGDRYISEILEWKAQTGLKHINFNEFKMFVLPTSCDWKDVTSDARIGNPLFPEVRPAELSKHRTIHVSCTVDYYLPETLEKMRAGNA